MEYLHACCTLYVHRTDLGEGETAEEITETVEMSAEATTTTNGTQEDKEAGEVVSMAFRCDNKAVWYNSVVIFPRKAPHFISSPGVFFFTCMKML